MYINAKFGFLLRTKNHVYVEIFLDSNESHPNIYIKKESSGIHLCN